MSDEPARPTAHHGARTTICYFIVVDQFHTSFIKATSHEHARRMHYQMPDNSQEILSIAEMARTVASKMDVPGVQTSLSNTLPSGDWVCPEHRGCGIVFRSPHLLKE